MPELTGGQAAAGGRHRNPDRRRLTAYDWWLLRLAVDEQISRELHRHPAGPILRHLRELLPLLNYRMDRAHGRESREAGLSGMLEDSPF